VSDTPETDAKAHEAMRQFAGLPTGVTEAFEAVDSSFARALERKLNKSITQAVIATLEQSEQPNTEVPFNRAESEALAKMFQAIGHLGTIAEDCEGWLNNQCDETACEFIKAVRDYARKAVQE
jgi:hypothetical protein